MATNCAPARTTANCSAMKHLKTILFALACLAIMGCGQSTTPKPTITQSSKPEEVDSLVQELWLDLNGFKLLPLKDWAAQPNNKVDFLSRAEAVRVAEASLKDHQVELLAVIDGQLPAWAQFVVCDASKVTNQVAYKSFLMSASTRKKLEVEFGNRWMIFAEAD